MSTEIRLKYIPAIFPVFDYTDTKKVDCRLANEPEDFVKLVYTDREWKSIDTPLASIKRKVQSVIYKKYYFTVQIKEKVDIQLIRIADEVTIVDNYDIERTINAFDIDLKAEKQVDSEDYTYTISFLELKNDDRTISNYLCNDFLLSTYNNASLCKLSLKNSKNIDNNFFFTRGINSYRLTNVDWIDDSGTYTFTLPLTYPLEKLVLNDVVDATFNPPDAYISTTLTVSEVTSNSISFEGTGQAGGDFTEKLLTVEWDYYDTANVNYTLTINDWEEDSNPGDYIFSVPLTYPLTTLEVGDTVTASLVPPDEYLNLTWTVSEITDVRIFFTTTGNTGGDFTGTIITLTFDYLISDSLDYYSRLIPFNSVKLVKKDEKDDDNSTPLPILKKISKAKTKLLTLYLTEQEAINFDWYIDIVDDITLTIDGTDYSIDYVETEYGKEDTELIGIVKRDLILYYETLNYYKYAP